MNSSRGTISTSIEITDASGSDQYYVNSPVGEYGILYGSGYQWVHTVWQQDYFIIKLVVAVIRKDVFLDTYN